MRKYFLTLVCALALLAGCCPDKDSDGDGVPDSRDKCPDTPLGVAVDSLGCPIVKEIGSIRLYIENSASNDGYFGRGKGTEFLRIISDLAVKVNNDIKSLSIHYIAKDIVDFPGNARDFIRKISTTPVAKEDGYELHAMFENILSRKDSHDVSIFVSDCILSYTSEEIRRDREINKEKAETFLKTQINDFFDGVNKKGMAASIYAFKSEFYGTYYNYRNFPIPLSVADASRPFYIWVIADKDILAEFNSKLSRIPTFRPLASMHFGLSDKPVSNFDIVPQIERQGTWTKTPDGIRDVKVKREEEAQFAILLNLKSLPPYAQDVQYLQQNLEVKTEGCQAVLAVKSTGELDGSMVKSDPQVRTLDASTHAVIITLPEISLSTAKISLKLPLKQPEWYKEWSCMDDIKPADCADRTFAFEHLIKGVLEAYDNDNEYYIDLTIKIQK